jgi:hypothetical protein
MAEAHMRASQQADCAAFTSISAISVGRPMRGAAIAAFALDNGTALQICWDTCTKNFPEHKPASATVGNERRHDYG